MGNSSIDLFQINRRSKSKQRVMIKMDWVKNIQLNEKGLMSEKLIDFGEITSLYMVTVNYFKLKNVVIWRIRGEYIWEKILSRKNNNWICENILKKLTSFKCNKNCIHLCLFFVMYTSYMRSIIQIKKFIARLVSPHLRLIPDFLYLSETFLRHTKVWVKDWNRIEIDGK